MTDLRSDLRVLQLLGRDGSVDREVVLEDGELEIGRVGSGFNCPDDAAMADRHARLNLDRGRVTVADSGKGSGVWLRITGSEGRLLQSGDQVWLGAQILVLKRDKKQQDAQWKIRHHGADGQLLESYRIPPRGVFIGRGSDLVLDAEDFRLSRRHAQLVPEGDELRLYDRGAHNGTFLKLLEEEAIGPGGEFRLSANCFRLIARGPAQRKGFETDTGIAVAPVARSGGRFDEAATIVIGTEPISSSEAQRDKPRRSLGLGARLRRLSRSFERRGAESADSAGMRDPGTRVLGETSGDESNTSDSTEGSAREHSGVERELALETGKCLLVLDSDGGGVSLEATIGQTILEAVQEAGLTRGEPVDWECGDGGCGVCVMGVVEGADRLDPPDSASGEMKTIQITEQVVPDPKKYRLACLARVRGTVRLRKLT